MYEAVRAVVGTKWTLEILSYLSEGRPANFTAIESEFETSSDVITEKLQMLTKRGLLDREERSSRDVRYSITDRGSEVLDLLGDLESVLD